MDADGVALRGIVAAPFGIVEIAEANAAPLVTAVNEYEASLSDFLPALVARASHNAFIAVGVVALNDFNDLLFDVVAGRGRSALRASRVMFEHLLNLLALDTAESQDRFMSHSAVGIDFVTRWNPVEAFLDPDEARRMGERLADMRDYAEPLVEEVISAYGRGFRRQWHALSLRDRAVLAGLDHEYEFFRASSAAVHGTEWEGSLWSVRGEPVARVGPSVNGCPVALAAGVRFLSQFLGNLETVVDLADVSIRGAVDRIGHEVQDFCAYTNGIEEYLFASDGMSRPPTRPEATG